MNDGHDGRIPDVLEPFIALVLVLFVAVWVILEVRSILNTKPPAKPQAQPDPQPEQLPYELGRERDRWKWHRTRLRRFSQRRGKH